MINAFEIVEVVVDSADALLGMNLEQDTFDTITSTLIKLKSRLDRNTPGRLPKYAIVVLDPHEDWTWIY